MQLRRVPVCIGEVECSGCAFPAVECDVGHEQMTCILLNQSWLFDLLVAGHCGSDRDV